MAQVWMIVVMPFVGLVVVTSLVVGMLGLGKYRFDTSTASHFLNATCYVNQTTVMPFSLIPPVPGYTTNCGATTKDCWGVSWEVVHSENTTGWIYSSGLAHSTAQTLSETYQVGGTYECWHISSGYSVISWEDWSPTQHDINQDVNLMTAGFATVVAFVMVLAIIVVAYFRVGEEKQPFYYHRPGSDMLPSSYPYSSSPSSSPKLLSSSSSSKRVGNHHYESVMQSPT